MEVPMPKWVYAFDEGSGSQTALLGGKGANLAEMTCLGLPVPPGFTITTDACRFYRRSGVLPEGLTDEVAEHLTRLEDAMGRRLGAERDPLLVSVRSGAAQSMPGMMDTVLNVGLNDHNVAGLAAASGDSRFAWDCCRRLVEMCATAVLGLDPELFGEKRDGVVNLAAGELEELVARHKKAIANATGHPFPQDPQRQLHMAIEAVFRSWDTERARQYRRRNNIRHWLGTAVTVQSMVFGNRGDDSGTGVAFTRNPLTGNRPPFGDYLPNAQGEDVVAGVRNTMSLAALAELQPRAWHKLTRLMTTLESNFRDMCDIEFTVEEGELWILQCRVGKRSGVAEWIIASDMVDEGLIDEATAIAERLTPRKFDELLRPSIRSHVKARSEPLTTGHPASPGAAAGRVVFAADRAKSWSEMGDTVILVTRDTTPNDYIGIVSSAGVLTATGGNNSHAAVVAREEGVPAVCGAGAIEIHPSLTRFQVGEMTVMQGDWITIDGGDGAVYAERLETQPSVLEAALRGDPEARASRLWRAYRRFSELARLTLESG
jgi:pyruvate,orthophosphate dikinase